MQALGLRSAYAKGVGRRRHKAGIQRVREGLKRHYLQTEKSRKLSTELAVNLLLEERYLVYPRSIPQRKGGVGGTLFLSPGKEGEEAQHVSRQEEVLSPQTCLLCAVVSGIGAFPHTGAHRASLRTGLPVFGSCHGHVCLPLFEDPPVLFLWAH